MNPSIHLFFSTSPRLGPSSESWAYPEAFAQIAVPGLPLRGGVLEASWSDVWTTSVGSFSTPSSFSKLPPNVWAPHSISKAKPCRSQEELHFLIFIWTFQFNENPYLSYFKVWKPQLPTFAHWVWDSCSRVSSHVLTPLLPFSHAKFSYFLASTDLYSVTLKWRNNSAQDKKLWFFHGCRIWQYYAHKVPSSPYCAVNNQQKKMTEDKVEGRFSWFNLYS